jgi:aminoglycoside phosphotransferase family enzyme
MAACAPADARKPVARARRREGVERSLAEKVEFLKTAAHYPNHPARVLIRETHMSWVFLAGQYVFKLKKPVRNRLFDFSSLRAREFNCREEVRLNRRLSPDAYLGVTALTRLRNGELSFGPGGRVIEWLVKMRRLPAERMLDALLARHLVRAGLIDGLASLLASFYRRAERPALSSAAYMKRLLGEQRLNREILTRKGFRIDAKRAWHVLGALDETLDRCRPLLDERVRAGFILEGHGDLRPEHICFTEPLTIFDCLEFNRELRLVDPFDELAFLDVECALLGAEWFGPALTRKVEALLEDRPDAALLRLYRMFRAILRARLTLAHLLDRAPREPAKWEPLADRYIGLAERFCDARP